MVLGATVTLASAGSAAGLSRLIRGERAETRRTVPLDAFYTGYRQTVMRPDELIVSIEIPRLREGETLNLYKVSKRKDLDISSVSAAIFLRREGDTVADVRIALGGVGPTVTRIAAAEDVIRGGELELDRFERAAAIVRSTVKPISDVRGSADYRRALAGNLLLKCFHDLATAEPAIGGVR
jgi:xanthine dehydrogenase small subunit